MKLWSALLVGLVFIHSTPAQTLVKTPDRFAYCLLRAGEVRPTGWLRTQLDKDFHQGLPGHLDEINKDIAQEVFAAQNRSLKAGRQPSWWPGEQEGYWHEAYVHAAFLLDDAEAIGKITHYVEAILKSQAPNGYIGIYDAQTRLLPVNDPRYGEAGGELHSQAHCFLTLLAFYEYTGRRDVLVAVERAARLSMQTYQSGTFGTAGARTPKAGGNSHVDTFIDPMMQLYRLTGNEDYLRFVATMYTSYNRYPPRDHDLTSKVLDDPQSLFVAHGAHTAESFHFVEDVALLGDAAMQQRAATALAKLQRHLTPGGALISDENIEGRLGNGHDLCEFCTQSELVKSLGWIAQYTGNSLAAELAARLFFNALQGARLHPLAALQYLSRDDRMDIPTNTQKDVGNVPKGESHFQMSSIIRPTCCPASAGRGLPYFLTSTWMKSCDGKTLAMMNAAPAVIATRIADVAVKVCADTAYPFSDDVTLTLEPANPIEFNLAIRLPLEGDIKVIATAGAETSRSNGLLVFRKTWQKGDCVQFSFQLPVVCETTQDGSARYYRRGSLTFGLPFASDVKKVGENARWSDNKPSGLFEYDIRVADKSAWGYRIDPKASFAPVALSGDPLQPWQKPLLGLRGTMVDPQGKSVGVTLQPEGASISRRVSFLDVSHSAEEAARIQQAGKTSIGN